MVLLFSRCTLHAARYKRWGMPTPPLLRQRPSVFCWKWPWDQASQQRIESLYGSTFDTPWVFKSLQNVSSLALNALNPIIGKYEFPRIIKSTSTTSFVLVLPQLEQGEAEQRALLSALASRKDATVLEFYSPECRLLLLELEIEMDLPIDVKTDNQGAVFIANNPVCHSKLKHVAMDFYFVREKSEQGVVKVSHISGKEQLADFLTKPLPPKLFKQGCCKLVDLCPTV